MRKPDLLLINPPFHRRNGSSAIFPLGLGYIIAFAEKSGYTSKVIDCTRVIDTYYERDLDTLKQYLREELPKYNPVLVGIGPCITTQVKALKIIAECCTTYYGKERVYAGGPLASIDNQEWFFFEYLGIDYIMKGDGEVAVAETIRHLKEGGRLSDCKYLSRRNYTFFNRISDINLLPIPTRLYLDSNIFSERRMGEGKKTASMITSRGCIYNCNYCVSGNMKYKKFRKRSESNIIDEMQFLQEEYAITDIIFYDDCFFYFNRRFHENIEKFCSMVIQRGISVTWQMEMRCDLFVKLEDKDISLLEQSGCRQINLGIEKTDVESLQFLGKEVPLNQLAEQIHYVKQISRIKIAGTFILGGKDETREKIKSMIEKTLGLGLDFAHYNPLFIYPGTPLYWECFQDETEWVDYILNDNLPWGEIVYQNECVNRNELIELACSAYKMFYAKSPYSESNMVADRFNLFGRSRHEDI